METPLFFHPTDFPLVFNPQVSYNFLWIVYIHSTACGHGMAYRKWKETKVHPGTAGPGNMLGCRLVSFHFLLAILCPQAVVYYISRRRSVWQTQLGALHVTDVRYL